MAFRRRRRVEDGKGTEDVQRVLRGLARLDPWSYWVARVREGDVGDIAVLGTTGAFLIAVCGLEGYLGGEGTRPTIDGRPVADLRALRKAARKASRDLGAVAVYTDVIPVVCLSKAMAGSPRTVKGVRIVRLEDLVGEIVNRERSLRPSRAEKGAGLLGVPVPRAKGVGPHVEDDQT